MRPNDPISAASVAAYLPDDTPWRTTVFSSIDSTNTALKAMAARGEREGCVLIAEQQTAGRGRMNRSFFSPPDGGLYMSMLLRPALRAEDALLLTTSAAVAAAEAIEAVLGISVGIKWVNDLFVRGRKVCGILCESSLSSDGGLDYAVVGIGINVRAPKGGFPPELEGIAGALLADGDNAPSALRSRLAAEILTRYAALISALPAADFLDEYRRRSLVIGRSVTLSTTGETVAVEGIDDACRLLVRTEEGTLHTVSSGECSILLS